MYICTYVYMYICLHVSGNSENPFGILDFGFWVGILCPGSRDPIKRNKNLGFWGLRSRGPGVGVLGFPKICPGFPGSGNPIKSNKNQGFWGLRSMSGGRGSVDGDRGSGGRGRGTGVRGRGSGVGNFDYLDGLDGLELWRGL